MWNIPLRTPIGNPIFVRLDPDNEQMFEIVAGERRWRAAQRAGLHTVPVIVRSLDDKAREMIAAGAFGAHALRGVWA